MTCAECDKPFEPAPHQAFQQRYCSPLCKRKARTRRKHRNRLNRRPKVRLTIWRTCPACNEDFTTHSRNQRFCSGHCARTLRSTQAKMIHRCPCGSEFLGYVGRRYCSTRCSVEAQRNYSRQWAAERSEQRRQDSDPRDLVYFIQQGTGPIKIGVSFDPDWRLGLLQCGNHEQLFLRHVSPGGLALEAELHERFAAHRIRGEWFEPVPELLDLIGSPQLRLVS